MRSRLSAGTSKRLKYLAMRRQLEAGRKRRTALPTLFVGGAQNQLLPLAVYSDSVHLLWRPRLRRGKRASSAATVPTFGYGRLRTRHSHAPGVSLRVKMGCDNRNEGMPGDSCQPVSTHIGTACDQHAAVTLRVCGNVNRARVRTPRPNTPTRTVSGSPISYSHGFHPPKAVLVLHLRTADRSSCHACAACLHPGGAHRAARQSLNRTPQSASMRVSIACTICHKQLP